MNHLKQLQNGIIGTQEDLDALSKKENASVLVVSDTHGQPVIFQYIVENWGPSADALIFAGDGISDLISVLDRASKEKSFQKAVPPVIAFVQGNNDPSSFPCDFNPYTEGNHKVNSIHVPKIAMINAAGKNIMTVHGNNQNVYYTTENLVFEAKIRKADAVVFGHTHYPFEMNRDIYIMNPGSISYPRHQSNSGFAMLQVQNSYIYSSFFGFNVNGQQGFSTYRPEMLLY